MKNIFEKVIQLHDENYGYILTHVAQLSRIPVYIVTQSESMKVSKQIMCNNVLLEHLEYDLFNYVFSVKIEFTHTFD